MFDRNTIPESGQDAGDKGQGSPPVKIYRDTGDNNDRVTTC